MTNLSPAAKALLTLDEAIKTSRGLNEAAYFLPSSVQEMFKDRKAGPLHVIQPWKTKKEPRWWVFPCPKEEQEYLKETLGLKITHLFVSTRFYFNDVFHNPLFNYMVGQFDEREQEWRWVDPSAPEDSKPKLSSWKGCKLINSWEPEERHMGASWWR